MTTPPLWKRHSLLNRLQTLLLLIFLVSYLALIGWLLWGRSGLVWLLLTGAAFALFSPAASPQLIMRVHRARHLAASEAPQLYRLVSELAQRAGLPQPPTLYYLPSAMINAFAVGTRRRAAVAVTAGLLDTLDERELAGVLAHELSHVDNNDIRVMSLADMTTRLTSALSEVGQLLLLLNLPLILVSDTAVIWPVVLIMIFAPQLSALAQLGLSRVREYDADLFAAALTGDPAGLASALVKLERSQRSLWRRVLLPGYHIPEPSLLRTHPPTEERVRRLLELERQANNGKPPPGSLCRPRGWALGGR
ncbi:zinc metalloprotease HtpX [Geoalkalibacter subterraneus]|jgi:heat shock protein HtpX|uniref:zinc metalloprotease HtpX n=1 Tax=Geoalkalibacter subterraneus TaxID=483547 RepID=UPI000A0644D5|nr:zinc metalloprotease HtpX [Geoalkalibacter subterraneus]